MLQVLSKIMHKMWLTSMTIGKMILRTTMFSNKTSTQEPGSDLEIENLKEQLQIQFYKRFRSVKI